MLPAKETQTTSQHTVAIAGKTVSAARSLPAVPVLQKVDEQKEEDNDLLPLHEKAPLQQKEAPVNNTNNTGMPDNLKAGVEHLSGISMNDVKVHYNSDKPFQLQALAYAQGTDIHIAPGQERHLPHEAWHVVQQKQGRVQPTVQLKTGIPVNDDAVLEKEADVMGAKAINEPAVHTYPKENNRPPPAITQMRGIVQRTIWEWNAGENKWNIYEATDNREAPPYIGKAGDYHDNDAVLGKSDLTKDEADRAAAIIKKNAGLKKMAVSQLLELAYQEAGILKKWKKDSSMFNILLDIGAAELKAMGSTASVTFTSNYKDSLAYTSCHNTAVKLMARMSAMPVGAGGYTGYDKTQAKEQKEKGWLETASGQLRTAIATDIDREQRAIYEAHCGGHGFVILIRNGQAEIVQSFANAVALVERILRGPLIFDAGTILQIVIMLASASKSDRDKAANAIAQCDADVFGLSPHPSYQYRWRRQPLITDAELVQKFKTDMEEGFAAIKGLTKLL